MANTDTTLAPEVAEAIHAIDTGNGVFVNGDDGVGGDKWKIVRAHLHRLAEENARLLGELEEVRGTLRVVMPLHEQAMAERDALKARIAEAPVQVRPIPPTQEGLVGARFAMVKLADGECE